jgi:hypothetical protein
MMSLLSALMMAAVFLGDVAVFSWYCMTFG